MNVILPSITERLDDLIVSCHKRVKTVNKLIKYRDAMKNRTMDYEKRVFPLKQNANEIDSQVLSLMLLLAIARNKYTIEVHFMT